MLSVVRAPSEENPTLGLRVIVQPMVLWLWIGGLIMVVGTGLSLFPGRRRNPLDPVSAPAPIETVEPAGPEAAERAMAMDTDGSSAGGDDDEVGSDESVGADR